jgi:hypothetical protein
MTELLKRRAHYSVGKHDLIRVSRFGPNGVPPKPMKSSISKVFFIAILLKKALNPFEPFRSLLHAAHVPQPPPFCG